MSLDLGHAIDLPNPEHLFLNGLQKWRNDWNHSWIVVIVWPFYGNLLFYFNLF